MKFSALIIHAMALPALLAAAETSGQTAPVPAEERPVHRIDIGTSFLNTVDLDSFVASLGYTYNVSDSSNLSVTLPVLDPDTARSGNSGVGDMVLAYSWVPFLRVSANPWVPRTVGTGVAVLAPTGNPESGRSLDAWIVAPYVGFAILATDRIVLTPQLGYVHSLDKTIDGVDIRLGFVELGFSFVALNGFWVSYVPQIVRDVESNEWTDNHQVSIGKMFSPGFGASVGYSYFDRFNFGSDAPGQLGFDRQLDLNIHFTF